MTVNDLDDAKKRAEYDRLMTAARVFRMRGDYTQAEKTVNQALELFPQNIDAMEFAADMLFARGQLEKAAEEYKRLFELDKSRGSLEKKYATALLQIAEGQRQQRLLQDMLENPQKYAVPARSPLVAAVISIAPGFGQIYCRQLTRGIVFCCVVILSWLMFYMLAPKSSEIVVRNTADFFLRSIDPAAVLFACLAAAVHVYALVDAAVLAGKSQEKQSTEV